MNDLHTKYRVNEQGMVIEYVNDLKANSNTEEPIHRITEEIAFRASQDTDKKPSLVEKRKSAVKIHSCHDGNEDAYHPDIGK